MIKHGVCGVVVTFRPKPEDLENFAKLRPQVQRLVVVDNGSPEEKRAVLRTTSRACDFTLLENEENLGIATALNIGVKWAQSVGCGWVALFDQDSTAPPAFIDTMLQAYERSPRRDRIGLIVPRYIDSRRGIPISARYAKDGSLQVAMTSGSLMPISIFSHEGWFEDSFFIGGVDYEYCLRLRSIGYSVEECADAVLLHAPAAFTECKVNGTRLFSTSNYSAGRRYYRERNTIWMIKRYWKIYPAFFVGMLSDSVKDGVKILLAETEKLRKVYYMALGVRDGLLGRMGRTVEL
jgi:rhamnosyltransferase